MHAISTLENKLEKKGRLLSHELEILKYPDNCPEVKYYVGVIVVVGI
jgi:hypothetical protein